MKTYQEFIDSPISEKVLCAWIQPRERKLIGWSVFSGSVYQITSSYFVVGVQIDGIDLIEANNSSLNAGEFFFDSSTFTLYVRTLLDDDPKAVFTSLEYRLFFSNAPYNLPYDLNTGTEVEYEPRISGSSSFGHNIDSDDLIGFAISGKGSLSLIGQDGYFDSIYDKLFWTDATVKIFTYSPDILVSDSQIRYNGRIDSKSYNNGNVKFQLLDFFDKLRDDVQLSFYSTADGVFNDSVIGTPKRRVYGRVPGLLVQSLDNTLDGFELNGSFSLTLNSDIITVSGGDLYNELSQGDKIFYVKNGEEISFEVLIIDSLTQITLTDLATETIVTNLKNLPQISYRGKNRTHLIAGHKLKEPATTIVNINQLNRIEVASTSDFDAGDFIYINSERIQIKRISGSVFILETNLQTNPSVSDPVTKSPVQKCYIGSSEAVFNRDFTVDNTGTDSKLIIDPLAEFNLSNQKPINATSLTFTNGSKLVTGISSFFTKDIKPRDWIKPDGVATWYEVLSITDDTNLVIRENFAEINTTALSNLRSPNYITDSTKITIDCLGITEDGTSSGVWIKTASQVVKHLITEAGLSSIINSISFTKANSRNLYLMGLSLPLNPNSSRPSVRDVINIVNKSIFGNISLNKNQELTYNVLSPTKPEITTIIKEDDVIRYSVKSTGKNIRKTISINYGYFDADRLTGESGSLQLNRDNTNVSYISKIQRKEDIVSYLYNENEADIIMQRIALLRESSNSVLNIKTKLNFSQKNLNDLVYFELDKIYERFGTLDKNRIGIITKVKVNGDSSIIEVSDLSGLYNKVAIIAKTGTSIYSNASSSEIANYGYIADSFGIVNNLEYTYRMNLIG